MGLPSNLFVVDAPYGTADADFAVTTCLDSFTPTAPWQQAGLLLYDDDDNFIKWVRQYSHVGRRILDFTREVNAEAQSTRVAVDPDAQRIWLRLAKRGCLYEFSSSTDGQQFAVHGELPWGEHPPKRLGLLAVQGGDCPPIDAHFDFFEVRPLTPEEKQNPRTVERQKLVGKWKAVRCRFSGKRIDKAPLSQFAFELPTVTVTEGTQSFQAEYTLDLAQRPARMLLSTERAGTTVVLTFIYAVDKEALLICFDPRPGAPVPGEFETRNEDGRLLVTFERVE
jgi:uncharacterized protein (TIGR03067 family)